MTTNGKSIGDENAQPPVDTSLAVSRAESKSEGKAMVPFENGTAKIQSIEGLFRIAEIFWRGNMLPQGVTKIEHLMIALMAGSEIGLSPTQSIQNIMVINNRPTLWGDAPLALAFSSGVIESIVETVEGDGEAMVATCRVRRKGNSSETVRTFAVADANKAGLWGKAGPWRNYPKRMLQLRARGFALRDSCPDVIKGLGIAEEVADFDVRGARPRARTPGADAGVDLSCLPQDTTREAVPATGGS